MTTNVQKTDTLDTGKARMRLCGGLLSKRKSASVGKSQRGLLRFRFLVADHGEFASLRLSWIPGMRSLLRMCRSSRVS